MADIKTRDVVKGTIKQIDKAAVAGQRMKQAYISTKERAENSDIVPDACLFFALACVVGGVLIVAIKIVIHIFLLFFDVTDLSVFVPFDT